ncbi:hypothetical protein [Leuconostoc gasicomitatum]|uniref:hypothetical protein n=1 Tax=Leuconostoc gasicomitatum TaxID=115778 RepID=UPI000744C721|nr:hypothetical protein [Leuconostoc gasicomitatum]MBZ5953710.1 hypothetical protein [Leuconostoc gasicomitatum]MBZ5954831.1 hypothetical protein [Leuconostoc gasicomitatum]MBZ5988958.1 hypothetical protein [Leuconostoc gasicomitatum]MBZ5989733.1 hypothetical protein [Leuconostoc gasicomitatum]CUR64313.1 Uncharacterized protein LEKG_1726 [Leuconostoc gasicomitatum KG16-1]
MKKGIKKAHPLPTKVVDEPCYKRPYYGFCYTHFNMKQDNNTKLIITLEQVDYINSLFDEPMFVIDMVTKTFKPVDEKRFHSWLDRIERGGEQ